MLCACFSRFFISISSGLLMMWPVDIYLTFFQNCFQSYYAAVDIWTPADRGYMLILLFVALYQLLALAKHLALLLSLLLDGLPRPQPHQSRPRPQHRCRQLGQPPASAGYLGRAVGRLLQLLRTSPEASASPEPLRSLRGLEPLQPSVPLPLAWAHHQSRNRFLPGGGGRRGVDSCDWRHVAGPGPQLAAPRWLVGAVAGGGVILPAIHRPLGGGGGRVPERADRRQPPGAADRGHSVARLPPEPTACHQDHAVHTGLEAQDMIPNPLPLLPPRVKTRLQSWKCACWRLSPPQCAFHCDQLAAEPDRLPPNLYKEETTPPCGQITELNSRCVECVKTGTEHSLLTNGDDRELQVPPSQFICHRLTRLYALKALQRMAVWKSQPLSYTRCIM